jgi:hypothetical protein
VTIGPGESNHIPQHTDLFDLDLYNIAVGDVPVVAGLHGRSDRAREDHISRCQRDGLRESRSPQYAAPHRRISPM